MLLKARYLPKEDRIQLEFDLASGDVQAFVLLRRQLLNLIKATGSMEALTIHKAVKAPKVNAPSGKSKSVEGVLVSSLGLKREASGLQVTFQLDNSQASFLLPDANLSQIGQMLFQQAESVGWDPLAGVNRLMQLEKSKKMFEESVAGTVH